ncbi:hypothetical protein OCU04_001152 [Sclerotinia nivalis]|uniref:Methyltransferase type 11 domain-containing protein n=1 Tax=Sclerotinia nivalis TaxID=352851 RepID=A0A9X0AXJ0_9HELO|nr:hypothetical protein OCU04_001152 [Sclerotinia nivalis]
MTGAIHVNRWAGYLRDMLRVLRPGGWAQLVELYHNVQSDNGSLTDGEFLHRYFSKKLKLIEPNDKPMHLGNGAPDTSKA